MKLKLAFILLFSWTCLSAQYSSKELINIHNLHPKSKIDSNLLKYAAIALPYFKEIEGVRLILRERKQVIPLTTIPSFFNIFRPKRNWIVRVNVSTGTMKFLEPILVKNMPDSAAIGVIGHELSHVTDFNTHKASYILKVFFWHVSPRKMDKFEFETDHIAIKAGFGKYLRAWSHETHTRLNHDTFDRDKTGKRIHERYMRVETIEKYMKMYPEIYP